MNRRCCILGLVLFSLLHLTLYALSQVNLSTTSLTFSPQLVGSVSAPQKLTLTNSGSSIITVNSIAASGGYSAKSNCSTLNPGDNCTISVTFLSGLLGTDQGVITINDTDASSPQLVTLSGSTLANQTLSPGRVNLGSVDGRHDRALESGDAYQPRPGIFCRCNCHQWRLLAEQQLSSHAGQRCELYHQSRFPSHRQRSNCRGFVDRQSRFPGIRRVVRRWGWQCGLACVASTCQP